MLRSNNSDSVSFFVLFVQSSVVGIVSGLYTQVEMQFGSDGYRLIVEENAAASSENVLLSETLEVTTDVQNRSVSE